MIYVRNEQEFQGVVAGAVPAVVMYGSPRCPHCTATKPKLEAFARRYPRLAVAFVDADALFMLADAQKVRKVPTLEVWRDGRRLRRKTGQQELDELEDFVGGALQ